MRGRKRQRTLDLEIGRNRQTIGERLYRHVVNRQPVVAGNQHDAFAHGLVVERARLGGDGYLGLGNSAARRG